MTAWSHLPNAALIDEVLASLKDSPEKWSAARGAAWDAFWGAAQDAARDAAWVAVVGAARGAVRDAINDAVRGAAWDAFWGATRNAPKGAIKDAARGAAWDAFWGAIAALIAYDDAGQFMKLPVDHLRRLHRLDPHPMFLLLQPAAIVFNTLEGTP
jgi:hypothetical protein